MEAMKFKVVSPEHSAQIQKKLFAEGYAWSGYNKEVLHDKARHLFAKDACITYEMEDVEYFKDHPNEEYVLVDGNFVKAEEQFKSMKIALSDPFANRTHVANVLNSLGYKFWGDAEVYNSAKAFFTYDSGIIMKTDDMEYFKSHPNEEYVLVGDELKKASEWFKQPVTSSFVQFENHCTCVVCEDQLQNTDLYTAHDAVLKPPVGLKPKKLHDQERLIEIIDAMYRYVSTDNVIPAEWFAEAQYLNGLMEGK
jgi:hypothetical protein